jgi:cyclophilin family peptidyl-prolyl cis-trans isomerase
MTVISRARAFAHSCIPPFLHSRASAFLPSSFRAAALAVVAVALCGSGVARDLAAQPAPSLIVVETTQGTFAFETYSREAPRSTAHIVALVKAGFYDGQRVHRAVPGFVVQFGDPQTRDLEKRALWGQGVEASSGTPIGVAEVTPKRKNVALAVGLAHMGEPAQADSQLYIMLKARPELDGQYAVIGHVVEGEDVPARLQVGDEIRRVYVRE